MGKRLSGHLKKWSNGSWTSRYNQSSTALPSPRPIKPASQDKLCAESGFHLGSAIATRTTDVVGAPVAQPSVAALYPGRGGGGRRGRLRGRARGGARGGAGSGGRGGCLVPCKHGFLLEHNTLVVVGKAGKITEFESGDEVRSLQFQVRDLKKKPRKPTTKTHNLTEKLQSCQRELEELQKKKSIEGIDGTMSKCGKRDWKCSRTSTA